MAVKTQAELQADVAALQQGQVYRIDTFKTLLDDIVDSIPTLFTGAGATVDTIADLTALDSDSLADGQRIYVHAYDAGGYGGGMFRWDEDSTAVTDGGVTFVPDDLTAAATEETFTYAQLNAVSGSRSLGHSGVVWGSFSITYNSETGTLADKWFHGHSMSPRHANLAATIDKPALSHSEGKLYRFNTFSWRNVIQTNANTNATATLRTARVNYRYTTGAGRWIREITDYVTPAMFGGRPGESDFDSSFFICWALNYIHYNSLDGIIKLKYDGNYYVKGMWGELFTATHQVGIGAENPCVTYMGDQGSGSGGVIDLLQTKYLGNIQTYLTNGGVDPYYLVRIEQTVQVQFDDSTSWHFDDFCVDGNIDNNLYFLTEELQTDASCTVPVASPGIVTLSNHGLVHDDIVVFGTDGNLPTGLTAGTHYYVIITGITTDTFRVAATQNGSAINFTGSESGNHTVTASHWHTEGVNGDVSQTLRESPTYGGFFITNQGGRTYGTDAKVFANNSTWKNMGGSPHAGAGGGFWRGNNLHFGKTISGREFYGGQGQINGLLIDGYSRSSQWSPYWGQYINVVQRAIEENPWPENQDTYAFTGFRTESYLGESDDLGHSAAIQERYGHHTLELTNWAGSNDGGDAAGSIFNIQGDGFKLVNGKLDKPPLKPSAVVSIFNSSSTVAGGMGLSVDGFDYFNRAREGVKLLNVTGTGYVEKATLSNIHLRDLPGAPVTITIASPGVVTWTAHGLSAGDDVRFESTGSLPTGITAGTKYYVLATDLLTDSFKFAATDGGTAINTSGSQSGDHIGFGGTIGVSNPNNIASTVSAVLCNLNMDAVPSGLVPAVSQQVLELNNLRSDVMHERLFDLEGGGSASGVPLDVHINGGYTTTRKNKLIKSAETDVTFSTKSRFFFTNHGMNLFDPGATSRGAADVTDPWIARCVFRGCWDRTTGKTSEVDKTETFTVTDGTTVTISNASPAVVGWSSHGMSNGARVQFQSAGGSLPNGLTAGAIYYVVNKSTDEFQVATIEDGTAVNTSSAGSGTFKGAKHDSEVLTAITNTNGYIDIPEKLMWKPMTYSVTPLSANAVTRGITSVTIVYPKSLVDTGVDNNTRPRWRVGVGTLSAGDVLTYRVQGAVAPMRSLA